MLHPPVLLTTFFAISFAENETLGRCSTSRRLGERNGVKTQSVLIFDIFASLFSQSFRQNGHDGLTYSSEAQNFAGNGRNAHLLSVT